MTKLIAVHQIERGRKATPSTVAPGKIWDATKQEETDLVPLNAARVATDEEIALADERDAQAASRRSIGTVGSQNSPLTEREILEAKAKGLAVKITKNMTDENLAAAVGAAEAKAKRAALEAEAKENSVEFTKDTSDEDLAAAITNKKIEAAGTNDSGEESLV